MIRILVVDDHPVVRAGIVALLEAAPDVTIVGTAASGEEALALVPSTAPDLVVMDLRMPGIDGDEATARILAAHPAVRVLILTTYETDDAILSEEEAAVARRWGLYRGRLHVVPNGLATLWHKKGVRHG